MEENVGSATKVRGWRETAQAAFELAQKFAVYPIILAALSVAGFVGYERDHYDHRIKQLSEDLDSAKLEAANTEKSLNQRIIELNAAITERDHEIAMLKCADNKDRLCVIFVMKMIRDLINGLPKEDRAYFVHAYISIGG